MGIIQEMSLLVNSAINVQCLYIEFEAKKFNKVRFTARLQVLLMLKKELPKKEISFDRVQYLLKKIKYDL